MDDLALSTSAFRDAAQCLKKYEYRWVDELVPLARNQSEALRRGLWIHRCLEMSDWGQDFQPELERMLEWAIGQQVDSAKAYTLASEVSDLCNEYLRHWSEEPDPMGPWQLAGTEVPVQFQPTEGVKLTATVDCLKKDNQGRL